MSDVHDTATRSRNMAAIRGRDTAPEVAVRTGLFRLGYRYRKNDRQLPGKPDLVFPKYRAVVFINGCFWHYHGCRLFKMPGTRTEWWRAKLKHTREVDLKNQLALREQGWRVMVVWECALRGTGTTRAEATASAIQQVSAWLERGGRLRELPGVRPHSR